MTLGAWGFPLGALPFVWHCRMYTVLLGCGSSHMARPEVGTDQGVCHAPPPQGQAGNAAGRSGPGQWAW